MIGKLLGRDVPATGFSIGFERVIGVLMERRSVGDEGGERIALVFDADRASLTPVLRLAREMREQGAIVSLELKSRKTGKQLHELESRGFRRIGVIADDGSVDWRDSQTRRTGESGA
jgi:histidyl-tRNA synthetase